MEAFEAVIDQASDYYQYVMTEKADPRVKGWLLLDNPVYMLVLTGLYLLIVWKGPSWMSKYPSLELKPVLLVYNFALVILSVYMFWEFFANTILNTGRFSMICQPVDYSDSPDAMRLANVIWWYYISKIIEFMDTFFFILRNKSNQVTFLHVYHHSTMVVLWYIGAKFVPGGESYYSAMINSFIHILMYSYYFLSALGPSMQKYLWWKKYMTSLQLIQFVAIIIHTSYAIYVDCGYPKEYQTALILYAFSHVLLFGNFYYHSYVKKSAMKGKKSTKKDGGKQSNGNVTSEGVSSHYLRSGVTVQNGVDIKSILKNGTTSSGSTSSKFTSKKSTRRSQTKKKTYAS